MSLLDKRIEDYRHSLKPVGYNALKRDGILTFRDLVRLTEQEVLRTPNLGPGSLNSIQELLCAQEPQLHLGMTEQEIAELETSLTGPVTNMRAQELLRVLAGIIVQHTSPDALGRLMKGTKWADDDEPSVQIALSLREEAKITPEEYRAWLTPALTDALAEHIGAKVTIE